MTTFEKITITAAAAVLAATFGLTVPAAAEFPEKPVSYIITFKPGGESDVTARFQQPFFKKMFGQELVISYRRRRRRRGGGSLLNGMAGDGYIIMGTNLPHIVLQPARRMSATRPRTWSTSTCSITRRAPSS